MESRGPVPTQRLTGLDASFLYLERKEIPLHMAGVLVFDGPLRFDEFVRRIDAQLHLIPRWRQIVVPRPFNLDYPTWEDDPKLDIRQHIFRVHLDTPGGEAELAALSGRIFSRLMDRGEPLWDFHVVDGLKNGRGALIVRIHHSLADGIAGAALLLKVILDPTPEGSRVIRKPRIRMPRRPIPKPSLAAALTSGIHSSLGHLIDAGASVLSVGQMMLSDPSALKGAVGLLPELVRAVERLPFNKPCSGDRKFCWAEFDLSEVQAIRTAAGGSVNDVILALLTRALARYVQLHGQTVSKRSIRVMCPVNLRQDKGESLGNRVSLLPVVLPLDVGDPVRMLEVVAARTAAMKRVRAADLLAVVGSCLNVIPPALQAMLWRGISNVMLPLPLLNIICTNIPGAPEPLYCVGRRLLTWYPQVPAGYDLGVNCAATSYCGKLCFGLTADAHVAQDVTRLRDFLYISFEELCLAAGVRKPARRVTVSGKPAPLRAKPPGQP